MGPDSPRFNLSGKETEEGKVGTDNADVDDDEDDDDGTEDVSGVCGPNSGALHRL